MSELSTTNPTQPPVPAVSTALPTRVHPPASCPVTLYLANDLTTAASRRGMLGNLKAAAKVLSGGAIEDPRLLDWSLVSNQVMGRLRALLLASGRAPSSVNTILAGVRGVLKQCWRLGQLTSDEYLRAIDVKPAKGSRVDRKGRCLTSGEVAALMAHCCADATLAGIRDAAVFGLAFGAGLRRAELVALRVEDHTPAKDAEAFARVVVKGKGNKERLVYLTNGTREALADWLAARGAVEGAVFLPVLKSGGLDGSSGGMTGQAIAAMMQRRARGAGVAAFSPHDCRRTFISGLLDHGVDISTAARLAGHASVETTRLYDRRSERAAIDAAGTVHVPYTGWRCGQNESSE